MNLGSICAAGRSTNSDFSTSGYGAEPHERARVGQSTFVTVIAMPIEQVSACVWDDIEETREAAEAMAHRSCLLMALMDSIRTMQQSDARIGARLGLPRKHVCQIRRGHWVDLDLETLTRIATTAGLQPNEIWRERKQKLDAMRKEIEKDASAGMSA